MKTHKVKIDFSKCRLGGPVSVEFEFKTLLNYNVGDVQKFISEQYKVPANVVEVKSEFIR